MIPENDEDTGRRVTGCSLRWKLRGDRIGQALTALHGRLAGLRSKLPASGHHLSTHARGRPGRPGSTRSVSAWTSNANW